MVLEQCRPMLTPQDKNILLLLHGNTLSASEQNYSLIEKEALSLIVCIRNFHKYVYGNYFTSVTDHCPLTVLFGPKCGVPALAAG